MKQPTDLSLYEALVELSAETAEAALVGMDLGVQAMRQVIGHGRGAENAVAPVEGPADLEAGVSELANRLLRLALTPGRGLEELPREAWEAAARSMPRELRSRWLTLPLELPLAVSGLGIESALRGLVGSRAMDAGRLPDLLDFVVEIWSDLPIYFTLCYGEEIERYRRWLNEHPEDARARLALGRTFTKCGLYPEAVAELELAGRQPRFRRRAQYETAVASYRAGDLDQAIRSAAACLAGDRGDARARYWLFLAAHKAGGYPASVPEDLRMEVVAGTEETDLELESVAAEIGLDKTSGGRGTAVFDFDGDGHLDVAIAGAHAGVSLFRNNGDGTFTDVSTGSGLDKCVYAFSIAAADYDNDGRPDLFVTGLGFFDGQGILMRNNGVGADGRVTFTDVTAEAGLALWGPGFTASWVDVDGNGWLDLFVVNNLGGLFDRKTPNRLFRNNGRGADGRVTFTDITAEVGLATRWPSLGHAWGDFSNNGLPDLFISNMGRAQLFRNDGVGRDGRLGFTDVSSEAGVDAPAIGSTALVCDIDDDGWLDIVQFTYSRPGDAIHTLRTGHGPPGGQPLRVFRNNRDGTFTDIARDLGLDGCWGTMSGNAADLDNDGRLDLLLGNGDPSMDRTEASILYQQTAAGRFKNVTFTAGLPLTGKGHGVNLADLSGDGRMHLIVGAGGLYPGDLSTTTVHRPKKRPGNYLNVRLVGTESNRDALGARLVLRAGGREQHRLVSGGSSFGCLPTEQHFGLGRRRRVDSLEIRWPGGTRQKLEKLPFNATIRVVEGEAGWTRV